MLIEEIKKVAKQAGEIMTTAKRPKIMEKSGHANFCTETDEKIQSFLIEKLKIVVPEAQFLGEEDGQDVFTDKMKSGYCFVIYAYRPSVVSIALLKEGRPFIGVVYNPYDDMMFSAEAGKGAYMNDEKIMSADTPLSESLALFGTAPYYTELQEKTFDIARNLLTMCVDLRRSGTAAWDMCCVALGRCNLYFELKIQLWDYAAAALIAEEAGCTVTDIEGNPLSYTGFTSVVCRARGVKEMPKCLSL